MSLRRKTASGVFWTGLAKMSMQLFLLVSMIILAQLLTKSDFGIVGMAAIVTVAITMVNDRGLGTAIIQRQRTSAGEISSLFWGGLLFGLLLTLITIGFSFPAARYFKQPVVSAVFSVQALGFIVGSFGIVQKSLLTRDMKFKQLAIIEIVSVLFSGTLSIVLALLGLGVWSLVLAILLRDLTTVILLWASCQWRPQLHFNWIEFKSFLGFSSAVLANDAAIYANTNADVTIIGRVLGADLLGVYTFALYLVKLPVTRLSGIVSKVVFPAFSLVQKDRKKFKRAYLHSMALISFFTFLVLASLAVFAKEFVQVVLPDKWLPVIVPLQILAPMAMLKSVGTIRGSVFLALGRPDIELKWNFVYLFPLVLGVLFGTRYGLNGVALAFSVIYVLAFPVIQGITNNLVGVSTKEYFEALKATSIATLLSTAAGLFFRYLLLNFSILPTFAVLLSGILLMTASYLATVYWIQKNLVSDIIDLVKNLRNKKLQQADLAV